MIDRSPKRQRPDYWPMFAVTLALVLTYGAVTLGLELLDSPKNFPRALAGATQPMQLLSR